MPLRRVALVVSAGFMALAVSAGCVVPLPPPSPLPTPTSVTGVALPFETLVKSEGTCHGLDTEAKLYFVTDPDGLHQALTEVFGDYGNFPAMLEVLKAALQTDFDTHAVLILLRTCQANSSYEAARIDRVVWQEGDGLYVYAQLGDPSPRTGVTPASGGYFHIVSVPWSGPKAGEVKTELIPYHVLL